ncbi:hypothetical protein [Streptomyces sp. HC307]|uniref:hypothetical protein n=1 Tax=Streptomyces flavusporus TaxID=3385496 RepID=UPI00391723F1
MNAFAGTSSYRRRICPGIPTDLTTPLNQAALAGSPQRVAGSSGGPVPAALEPLPYLDDLFAGDAELAMVAETNAVQRPVLSHDLQLRSRRAPVKEWNR